MVGFYKDGSRMFFFDNLVGLATFFFILPHTAMLKQRYTFFFC